MTPGQQGGGLQITDEFRQAMQERSTLMNRINRLSPTELYEATVTSILGIRCARMNKDEILTIIAAVLLLFTALIDWDIYSWFILVGVLIILIAWYFRKTDDNTPERTHAR